MASREHALGIKVDLEKDERLCIKCKTYKPFIFSKAGPRGVKKFVDGNGRKWNSQTCYDCHQKVVKRLVNARNRLKAKLELT